MNLSLIHARSFGRPLFIRPTHSYLCTITHQAQQNHLKQIYKSPNVSRPLLGFFSSSSWIMSSSAKVSSVSRKQDFCESLGYRKAYLQGPWLVPMAAANESQPVSTTNW